MAENSFPDEFVNTNEKLSDDWALKVFKQAYSEHSRLNYGVDSSMISLRDRTIAQRKLAEGTESNDDVKLKFLRGANQEFVNLNYDISSPLTKLVATATRTVYNIPLAPQATPVDATSISKAGINRNKIIAEMKLAQLAQEFEENDVTGVIDKKIDKLPKNQKEFELHEKMNPKTADAVAQEYLIRQGLMQNNWEYIKQQLAEDLVRSRMCVSKVYFDTDNNLKVKYVDLAEFVSSRVTTPDFKDARYMGEDTTMTIADLREMSAGKVSDEDLQWISEKANGGHASWNYGERKSYYNPLEFDSYKDTSVRVWYLQFKTYDKSVHIKKTKSNKGFEIRRRNNDYKIPDNARRIKEVIHSGAQAIYHGYWVVGTDTVIDWKRKDNAFKQRVNKKWSGTAEFDYSVNAPNLRDMQNKSLVDRAKYRVFEMKLLCLKSQQFLIQADPPGYSYDSTALLASMKGMGFGGSNPIDMVDIKSLTGRYFFASRDGDEIIAPNGTPIKKIESGIDQSLIILADKYNRELALLKDELGIPDAISGTNPDKDSLVGVQQIVSEGHKSALSDLINALEQVTKETANKVYMGFQMQIINKINIPEIEASLGELLIKEVELSSLSKADFRIDIELLPTQFEQNQLDFNLQQMVVAGQLSPEDKYEVMQKAKESMKMAIVLMGYKASKFKESNEQAKIAQSQAISDGNIATSQATAQAEAKNIQLKYDLENRNALNKVNAETQQMQAEYEEKKRLSVLEADNKVEIKQNELDSKVQAAIEFIERTGYNAKEDSLPKELGSIERDIFVDTSPAL